MNDLDAKEASLLAGVRRSWSPGPGDQARVLGALNAALLVPEPAPAAGSALTASRRFLGVLALGVAGLVGYGWGYRAGSAVRVAPAVAAAGGTASPPASASVVAEQFRAEPHPSIPDPSVIPRSRPTSSSPAAVSVQPPVSTRTTASSSPHRAVTPSAGLDEEVRQLRRIERALRAGNPRLALVLAEDLDRAIPKGQLALERRAAALMANCQLDAEGANESVRLFLAANPDSPYAPRVREMCAREQRIAPPGGTDASSQGGK